MKTLSRSLVAYPSETPSPSSTDVVYNVDLFGIEIHRIASHQVQCRWCLLLVLVASCLLLSRSGSEIMGRSPCRSPCLMTMFQLYIHSSILNRITMMKIQSCCRSRDSTTDQLALRSS